jgi:porin
MSARIRAGWVPVAGLLFQLGTQMSSAEGVALSDRATRPSFGGPDAIENQIESDRAVKDVLFETELFKPYLEWKESIREKDGLSLGTDYTSVLLSANDTLPGRSDDASSGLFRFFGTWELLGRGTDDTGTLSFKFDHRHLCRAWLLVIAKQYAVS